MQAHAVVAHVAFNFRLRREGCHGVDNEDVDGRGTDKLVGDFKCLFAVVGLRNNKFIDIHAKFFGIEAVESVLSVDECGHAPCLLCLCNGMDGKGGLTRRFGAVDFDDASARIAAHAERGVEGKAARRDNVDVLDADVAHFHYRALAEVFFDFCHGGLQGFEFLGCCRIRVLVHICIYLVTC